MYQLETFCHVLSLYISTLPFFWPYSINHAVGRDATFVLVFVVRRPVTRCIEVTIALPLDTTVWVVLTLDMYSPEMYDMNSGARRMNIIKPSSRFQCHFNGVLLRRGIFTPSKRQYRCYLVYQTRCPRRRLKDIKVRKEEKKKKHDSLPPFSHDAMQWGVRLYMYYESYEN